MVRIIVVVVGATLTLITSILDDHKHPKTADMPEKWLTGPGELI